MTKKCGPKHKRKKNRNSRLKKLETNPIVLSEDNVSIGSKVFARCSTHDAVKTRPFMVWSMFFDTDMNLVGIEGLNAKRSQRTLYPSDLCIPSQHAAYVEGVAAQMGGKITTSSGDYLNNDPRTIIEAPRMLLKGGDLEGNYKSLLPDLVLRRTNTLCRMLTPEFISIQLNGAQKKIACRRGIVLPHFEFEGQPKISLQGFDNKTNIITDISGTPFDQEAFTVPGYMERDDIAQIFNISNNYYDYCKKRELPCVWPELRQWKSWPDEFMKFAQPQDPDRYKTPWFDEDSPCSEARGFAVNYTSFQPQYVDNPS